MEVRATAKYVRVQPRKVRIIADEVRGKNAGHAAALLHHHTSKGAKALRKVLINAVANAVENHGLAPENLKISVIMVDEGPRLKRMIAKAMGRGAAILKKTSHITVVVEEADPELAVRPHGAKAKARPTFATKPAGRPAPAAAAAPAASPEPAPVMEPEDSPSTTTPSPAPVTEPEILPGTESAQAAPEEATPVTASDAPEEGGTDVAPSSAAAAPVVEGTAAAEASPVTENRAPEEEGGATGDAQGNSPQAEAGRNASEDKE